MLAFSFGDLADLALAVFLVAVGVGLAWAFLRLAGTFDRISSLIRGTERELVPVITKVGGSVDRVNTQLDKLDQATDSAVDAVDAIDQAVRTVSFAVKRPIQKLAGLGAGVSHGWSTFRTQRDFGEAMAAGREAAVRRERDLDEELPVPTTADEIRLTIPGSPEFHRVVHLVVGGLAARLELTVDDLEDLELALDALLSRTDGSNDVTVSMTVREGELVTTIGPVSPEAVDELERDTDGRLGLRRVLEASVDDVRVDGDTVRLAKRVAARG